jgi:hypothetical protein
VIYDALYSWCQDLQHEVHNWTPPVSTAPSAGG